MCDVSDLESTSQYHLHMTQYDNQSVFAEINTLNDQHMDPVGMSLLRTEKALVNVKV